jgi:hypothetical protein
MKTLIASSILISALTGCSFLTSEDAKKIDNNFSVVQSVLKGMDERIKKLEAPKATATPGRGQPGK